VVEVFESVAARVVGPAMQERTEEYARLLRRASLAFDVPAEPKVFLASADAWIEATVRYVVPARERRRWASALVLALSVEIAKPEHQGRSRPGYPRTIFELPRGGPARPEPAGE
jgi:small conductance mechanosensitive channel